MSLLTAIRLPKSQEHASALPSVEDLQAHYDLPSYGASQELELQVAFRDIGYAKVAANAVRKYLPKILTERGVRDTDAHTNASSLAERIEDSGITFQGLNQATGLVTGSAEEQADHMWDKHALHGQEATDTLEAIDAMVVHEAPAREHTGTYAGAIALHMLETMPDNPEQTKIALGS